MRTENRLMKNINAKNKPEMSMVEASGNQYFMMMVAAEISAAMVIAQLNQ